MGALRAAAAAAAFALVGGVQAADLKIIDIKAYAFLEHNRAASCLPIRAARAPTSEPSV